jgi:type VI secretion system protein ImpH
MAAPNGRTPARLSEQLLQQPQRFDFFQAVRVLEWLLRERAAGEPRRQRGAIGQDFLPEREIVRFRALPSLSFPATAIASIREPQARERPGRGDLPLEMFVAFFGLMGHTGTLPYHYTALLQSRLRGKDFSLRDWLDLFNHRLVSLFYRAWEKYHLPIAYERSRLNPRGTERDTATEGLSCLVGLGTAGLRGRLDVCEEAFLHYSGLFAHHPRSAISLERLLEDYFELPIRVQELQGEWLYLEPEDLAEMPNRQCRQGRNNQLGRNCVAGVRVWDVQSKIRLRVGPLSYEQFRRLMPNGEDLRALCQMTRFYLGPNLGFDVQPILKAAEVPWCKLTSREGARPLLGWNTWLHSRSVPKAAEDAVFSVPGV